MYETSRPRGLQTPFQLRKVLCKLMLLVVIHIVSLCKCGVIEVRWL